MRMADEFYGIAADRVNQNLFAAYETYRAYPVIVNYSFSCELYIKALMMYRSGNSTFAKGHRIKDFIDNHLNPQDRNEIRKRCEAVFRAAYDQNLDDFDKAFEDWRYDFEVGKNISINIDDLIKFAKVMKAYTHEVTGL